MSTTTKTREHRDHQEFEFIKYLKASLGTYYLALILKIENNDLYGTFRDTSYSELYMVYNVLAHVIIYQVIIISYIYFNA